MHHLQIPERLQDHIDYRYYQSGHMVYAIRNRSRLYTMTWPRSSHSTDHLDK